MESSATRAVFRLLGYVAVTVPLMPVQALLLAVNSSLSRRLPHAYHRIICRVLGVDLILRGEIAPRPALFVSNHVSYLDIEVLSAAVPTCFVAKREVAGWPLFGWLAKLQRTVFVDRRVASVANERDDLARRLDEGDNVVLFPEGTSGDGNRLLPFKSALLSVAERTVHGRPLTVQPVSIAYTQLDGMPLGRQWRPFVAWYGAMDLAPHLWTLMGLGRLTAQIEFHPPVSLSALGSRKALAAHCQSVIARGLESANCGREVMTIPAAAAETGMA
jgi:1-acyl-sn-glycerol-3-phosphate acyltransferase